MKQPHTLADYLSTPNAPTLTDLSARCGVTPGRLSQLRDDLDWPPEIALKVEEQTDGALDAARLSPLIARARKGIAA